MSVPFYMDVHVPGAVTRGLRRRGVDCLTAQEDGMDRADDPILLDRALALGRVVFTQDHDFLREAAHRMRNGIAFAGVVFAEQRGMTIGRCVIDLEIIAQVEEPSDWMNRLEYLPL